MTAPIEVVSVRPIGRGSLLVPDLARLRELLSYDPETGILTWRKRRGAGPSAGSQAGCRHGNGYIVISIDGVQYSAHRLAFYLMTGSCPGEIDHRDLNKANNRWENIRPATTSQNQANTHYRGNRAGHKGVYPHRHGKWRARITFQGSLRDLGIFERLEDAAAAYERAARELFGEFARVDRRAA